MTDLTRCEARSPATHRCTRDQHGEDVAHRDRHGKEWGGPEMIPATDWLALKQWLAKQKQEARHLADANAFDLAISAAFEAQVEILACAEAFMAEREEVR